MSYESSDMKIGLEDNYEDVLGKAQRGLGLINEDLAERAGVGVEPTNAVLAGEFDADIVRALCRPLNLVPDRVVALGEKTYVPEPIKLDGLLQFNTPFEDMTVNAFLVWDPARRKAGVFDTGSDTTELLDAAKERGLEIERIFITHSHGDHIFDLDRTLDRTAVGAVAPSGESVAGTEQFEAGTEFKIGDLVVETRLTWGHARGSVTYVVRGLDRDVAICGDAIFAGSMGGGMVSYEAALKTNREQIFSLDDETVLCPGHGPLTTVGEQRRCNPFFPEVSPEQ